MNIDSAIDTSPSVDIAKRLRLRADHWEIDHTYTASISDPKWDREAADEIEYLRTLITAWCDAMDAEWEASYDELASAVTDRMDAEKYLRAAVGR